MIFQCKGLGSGHSIIINLVKSNKTYCLSQLQHIVAEENCIRVNEIFNEEKRHKATGGRIATIHQRQPVENTYQKRAEQLLADENCFKIVIVSRLGFFTPDKPMHCSAKFQTPPNAVDLL